jgi:hypothetical protein
MRGHLDESWMQDGFSATKQKKKGVSDALGTQDMHL